jgi:hypothetical protein
VEVEGFVSTVLSHFYCSASCSSLLRQRARETERRGGRRAGEGRAERWREEVREGEWAVFYLFIKFEYGKVQRHDRGADEAHGIIAGLVA